MVAAPRESVATPVARLTDRSLVASLWSRDVEREHGFEPLEIEGTLPASLRGTLYRNGPGQFGQFGARYSHPFEADGCVTAVRIADGKATGAVKIHATAGLTDERTAGRVLYGFSAPWHQRLRNTLNKRGKNTANTNIVHWQGRMFALMEAGRPTEVSPTDLATLGETDLGGVVHHMFSAHPHRVASRHAAYNFGLEYGRVTKLHLYELPDAGPARHLGAVPLAGPPMLHDFIATDTHLIFFVSPVRVDVKRALLQYGRFDQFFRWQPQHGTEIIAVPIDDPSAPVRFTVEAFYQWHFANAFTRDAATLVVDYIHHRGFDSFYEFRDLSQPRSDDRGLYHRATLDLRTRSLRTEPLSDRSCEFPTVMPGTEGQYLDRVFVTLDDLATLGSFAPATRTLTTHTLPSTELATEPVYADGHVMSLCHTRDRAFVAVYDANKIPDGPVARLWFDHHIPISFHGTFVKNS